MQTEFNLPGLNCPENQENYWSLQKEEGGFNLSYTPTGTGYLYIQGNL